jgi:hypothetical protein
MSIRNEKQLVIECIDNLTAAIENMNNMVLSQDSFLRDNFRNYPQQYSNNVWHFIHTTRGTLGELRQLAASNKDNAHRLEQEPKDSGVTFVEGDYPQNHSIQEAQRRVGEYPMDSLDEPGW